jgi:Putative zinc-finger
MDHLTDSEFNAYLARDLQPDALLRVTDHLTDCEDCRARLRLRARTGETLGELRQTIEMHLTADQLQRFVDGDMQPEEHSRIDAHLQSCAECAGDVRELQVFASTPARPMQPSRPVSRWWLAAAAAIVLALGLGLWLRRPVVVVSLNDEGRRVSLDSRGVVEGVAGLSGDELASVRRVLERAALVPTESLAELQPPRSSLMGSEPVASFRVLSPVGIVVRSSAPELRWTTRHPSATYVVTLKNLASGKIVSSPVLHELSWTPVQPLERGAVYAWQVAASLHGQEEIAPSPPSPQARFRVVSAGAAERLVNLPASHLARAVFELETGLLDDAEQDATALLQDNPGSAIASDLLRNIRALRGSAPAR